MKGSFGSASVTVVATTDAGFGILLSPSTLLVFKPGQSVRNVLIQVVDDLIWTNPSTPRARQLSLTDATGGAIIISNGKSTTTVTVLENDPKPKIITTTTTPSPATTKQIPSTIKITVSLTINVAVSSAELMQPAVVKDMEVKLAKVLDVDLMKLNIIDMWYCPDSSNTKCVSSSSTTSDGAAARRRTNGDGDNDKQIYIEFFIAASETEIQDVENMLKTELFSTQLNLEASTSLSKTLNKDITVTVKNVQVTERTGATGTPNGFRQENHSNMLWYGGLLAAGLFAVFVVMIMVVIVRCNKKGQKNRSNKIMDDFKFDNVVTETYVLAPFNSMKYPDSTKGRVEIRKGALGHIRLPPIKAHRDPVVKRVNNFEFPKKDFKKTAMKKDLSMINEDDEWEDETEKKDEAVEEQEVLMASMGNGEGTAIYHL